MAILEQIPAERIIAGDKALAAILGKTQATICQYKKKGILNYLKVHTEYYYDSANLFAKPEEREQPCQK